MVEKCLSFFHGFRSSQLGRSVYRQPIFVDDGEAVESGLPVVDRHGPFFRDVSECQIKQFHDGLVVRK